MLKLKRFDKAEWFTVPEFEGVRLLIKPSSFVSTTKILSTTKRKIKVDKEFVDDYDDGAFALALFKDILVDFEGIETDGDLTKDEQKEVIYYFDVSKEANSAEYPVKIKFTGKKYKNKKYYWHTGYLGSLKERKLNEFFEKDPKKVILLAIKGMLPKNKLREKRLKRIEIKL